MAVGAVTSLIGGKIQSDAAKEAGAMQSAAMGDAVNLQRQMFEEQRQIYEQQRQDQAPWMQAGTRALSGMEDADFQRDFTMSDFQKDPGYDFRMQEGMKALERSAASRGSLQGGATLKALSRYNQDFASNEFNNAYNRFNADRDRRFGRLSSLAGFGQNATNAVGAAGNAFGGAAQNFANQGGQLIAGAGNANAASRLAQGQAWADAAAGVNKAHKDEQKNIMYFGSKFMGGLGG